MSFANNLETSTNQSACELTVEELDLVSEGGLTEHALVLALIAIIAIS